MDTMLTYFVIYSKTFIIVIMEELVMITMITVKKFSYRLNSMKEKKREKKKEKSKQTNKLDLIKKLFR